MFLSVSFSWKKLIILSGFLFLIMMVPNSTAQEVEEMAVQSELIISEPIVSDFERDAVRMSDSPHLRVPQEILNLEPVTPYDGPPVPLPPDPTASITHDLATGVTTVTPSSEALSQDLIAIIQHAEQYEGLTPAMMTAPLSDTQSPIGADDRTRITGTGSYPWRTITRLAVTWSDGSGSLCSGALIDSYHILTAGHCVFDFGDNDAWASRVQVFPGLNDDYMPYNRAWVTRFHSYTGWTQSGSTLHDWAVVAIDRSVGDFTGWMGRQTADSNDGIYTGVLNVAGYPGTPPNSEVCPTWGNCLYFDSDDGHSADTDNHWYWMDTSGGMSGGPVWRYNSNTGTRHILTTHTCGTGGCGIASNSVNHGTRLNQDKYDRIISWIDGDSDITPNDRADLIDDGPTHSGFSPSTIINGNSFSAWSDVRNIGTASSGGFYVSYFASSNNIISTSDYFIGNVYVNSMNGFTWSNANLSNITFPSNIPDGTYYVGWMIDRYGTVTEFDEGNNTAYETDGQLTVCNTPSTPSIVSPTSGARTADNTPTFDWNTVSGSTYRLQIDNNSDFSSPVINVSVGASAYTPYLADGTYYWRVRAEKNCGADSAWSTSRILYVVDTGPVNYVSNVVDDDKIGQSYGDGDGIPDCGETVELDVTMRNNGSDYASGVNVELSTTNAYASFPYNTSSGYPIINGNTTAVNSDDYDIALSETTPHGTNIPFLTTATSNEGGPWYYNFYLYVNCLPPAQPTGFDASLSGLANIQFDWTAVADAETYEVWWSPFPYGFPTADCAIAPNCTSTTNTNHTHYNVIGNGNFYSYTLYAVSLGEQRTAATHQIGKMDFTIVPGN